MHNNNDQTQSSFPEADKNSLLLTQEPQNSKGRNVIEIIESNISKVLLVKMPINKHIIKARETLIYMIDNLPEDNFIYPFVMKNINENFIFNAKVLNGKLIPNQTLSWINIDPYSLPIHYGGTYIFHQKLTGHEYIGSAACHSDRVDQHKSQFKGTLPRALHVLEKDNQETLLFSIIHILPNFFKLFRQRYPNYKLMQGQYDILLALTVYPSRILEQDLINNFKPFINGKGGLYDTTVYHRFTDWQKSRLNDNMEDTRGSLPINIYDVDGYLAYTARSHNDARKYLGMSSRSVYLYVNNSKSFFSTKLNKSVTLREPGFLGNTVKKV